MKHSRDDFKGPNETHANEEFEVHDKLFHFGRSFSTGHVDLVGLLENADHGQTEHAGIDEQECAYKSKVKVIKMTKIIK